MKVLKSLFVQHNFASPSFRNDLLLNEVAKTRASEREAEMSASRSTQRFCTHIQNINGIDYSGR